MTDTHSDHIQEAAADAATGFAPLLLEADRLAHTIAAGLHGRRRAGPGESFWQHRPYVFGDPVTMIDWRQSARSAGPLYVRQNEWEAAATAWIWRDPSASMTYASVRNGTTKRMRADVIAGALAILLSQGGERIGVIGGRNTPFHGRNAPAMVLEALNSQENTDATQGLPATRIREDATVLLLSDFFMPHEVLLDRAGALAAQGARGVLFQVLDPAEALFPFSGRIEFSDLETPDRLVFGDATALQSDYLEAFAQHQDKLADIARTLGWAMITHRTDGSAISALLSAYISLSEGPTPPATASASSKDAVPEG